MSLATLLKPNGPSGFGANSTAEQVTQGLSLTGKTFVVTGCNSGLGLETTRVLALRGAKVVGAARTLDKAQSALSEVHATGTPVSCELSEPSSIKDAVIAIRALNVSLDGIICNAGIMALPKLQRKMGYELQFFTNHIGHFLLVTGLLDLLAPAGRVVMLSSGAHMMAPPSGIEFDNLTGEKGYSPWRAYGQAKLANLLFAKQLAKRMPQKDQTANSVHPGVIQTNLARHMNIAARVVFVMGGPLFLKTIPQGAATQCYVATHASAAGQSGLYFSDCNPKTPSAYGQDAALAEKLWDKTEEIVRGLLTS